MNIFKQDKTYFKLFYLPTVICAVYILYLVITFKKWIFFPWDIGREMFVPYKLLQGEVLYRDIFYHYGPLAPYLISWLWRFSPVSLNTFYFFGVITSSFCVYLVYRLCLKVSGRSFALIVTLFFINFNVFIPTRANLVFPYSFAYSLSVMLTFSVLILAMRYFEETGRFIMPLLSCLVGIMLITKLEFGLASFATVLFAILIKNIRQGNLRLFLTESFGFSFFTSIIPLLTFIVFSLNGVSPLKIIKSLFPQEVFAFKGGALKDSVYNAFNWQSLKNELFYLAVIIVFTLNLIGILKNIFKRPNSALYKVRIFFNIIIFFLILILVKQYRHFSDILSAMVIISLPALIFFLINLKKISQPAHIYLGIILCNSFLLYLRDKPSLCYSHATSVLSLLLLAWALLYVVSAWADKTLAKNILGYYRKTIYSVLGAVFLLFFLLFAKIYGEMDFLLKTDRGSFFVPACYGQVYAKTINWLKGNTDKNDTVIALPEGAWLNFLLERKYPYYYIQWMPYFMPSLEREFKTKPSDIVILMWPWGCQFWPWGYNSLEPSLDFSSQVLSKSLTHDYSKVFTDKSSCYAYIGLSKVKLDNYTVIYQRKKP